MQPAEFINKWKDNKLSERAEAQAQFLDLCEPLGVEKPSDPDRIIPNTEFLMTIKERTPTNLCNSKQKSEVQWLTDAHRTLDAAVARAYGWDDYTPEMADGEILRRLLKPNLERAKQ